MNHLKLMAKVMGLIIFYLSFASIFLLSLLGRMAFPEGNLIHIINAVLH